MLFRIILFGILIILIIRMFNRFTSGSAPKDRSGVKNDGKSKSRKVSKDVGEYVDYEEVDD